MIAKNLISTEIQPVKLSDTGDEILALMSVFHVKHLPIVEDNTFLGLISEDDIYQHNENDKIRSYAKQLNNVSVQSNDHLFEVMAEMSNANLTIIPVIDENNQYIGSISQEYLLNYYATSFSFTEPGSILILEMAKSNYSLVEISSIVEQEHAVILGTFLSSVPDTNLINVTLKINKLNINRIIASFQRHDYIIAGSFYEDEYFDNLKSRYDGLMNYLSI